MPPVDKIIKEKLIETNKIKMFKILRIIYVIFAIIVVSNSIPNSLNNQDVCSITESLNVLQVQNTVELKQNTISENSANTVNTENGRYHGEFVNGKMQGKGTYEWKDESKYVGEFESNKLNGKGTLIIPGKGSYEGNFKNGKKNGQGIYSKNGKNYIGTWKDNKYSK